MQISFRYYTVMDRLLLQLTNIKISMLMIWMKNHYITKYPNFHHKRFLRTVQTKSFYFFSSLFFLLMQKNCNPFPTGI